MLHFFATYIECLQFIFFLRWILICILPILVSKASENAIMLILKKFQQRDTQRAPISLATMYCPVCETVCSQQKTERKTNSGSSSPTFRLLFFRLPKDLHQKENPNSSSDHRMFGKENKSKTEHKKTNKQTNSSSSNNSSPF